MALFDRLLVASVLTSVSSHVQTVHNVNVKCNLPRISGIDQHQRTQHARLASTSLHYNSLASSQKGNCEPDLVSAGVNQTNQTVQSVRLA